MSYRYETRVFVQNTKPNLQALLDLLNDVDLGGTQKVEWEVDIECKVNDLSQTVLAPTNRYRWEITLTRRIK